jgi:hypothetical protein
MPSRQRHLEFDEVLRKKGVICQHTNGNTVHSRMDKGSKWFADAHREIDHFHSHSGIRDTIDNIVKSIGSIYQSTATDYVRIAYGHLCLDYMASKLKRQLDCTYGQLDWEYVYKRTWNYYKAHGLHRTYYKARY